MFNPFKKRKPDAADKKKAETKEREPETKVLTKAVKERSAPGPVLIPHLTEKAMTGGVRGWYAFRVPLAANKTSAKKAVEKKYGVKVMRVRIAPPREKSVRLGRIEGRAPGFKKVMVKVKEGQSIEFT